MPKATRGLSFNLRSTLAPNTQTRVEETSGLLTTQISGNANGAVPCALAPSVKPVLSRLQLKSALRPLGAATATVSETPGNSYARVGLSDDDAQMAPARLTHPWCRLRFWVCGCFVVGLLASGAVVLIYLFHQVGRESPPPPPPLAVAPPPPLATAVLTSTLRGARPSTSVKTRRGIVGGVSGKPATAARRPPPRPLPRPLPRPPPPPPLAPPPLVVVVVVDDADTNTTPYAPDVGSGQLAIPVVSATVVT